MHFGLSEEQRLLVDTIGGFVDKEMLPHEETVERLDAVPAEIFSEIKGKAIASGLYAANMPEELGGGGLGTFDTTLFEMQLGRVNMALQLCVYRPSNILLACVGAQREEYLLPTVAGERLEALAMTEPNAGSDLRSMSTTARADGGDYLLNGTKHFISHADLADYVIVFAATGEDATPRGPRKRITAFLIDKDTPGFEVRSGYHSVSHRGYHNCVLTFDDCRVPASKVLGQVDQGFEVANQWLGATRIQVAALSIARARRALGLATDWAATRQQFGQTIGRNQGISFKLAEMVKEIRAAELLTLEAAWKDDQGVMSDQDAAIAKLHATETLALCADEALQIHGGMGLMTDLPLERIWRDARVERIWEGTSEIQRHIISRSMLRPLGS